MSHVVTSSPPAALEEADDKRERRDVHKNILDVTTNVNRILTEMLLDRILKQNTEVAEPSTGDGFVYCNLVVQSLHSSSEEVKFRVKLDWKGLDVKKEVHRLYDIPTTFQVLLINDKTVSDQQPISDEMFAFKPVDQVIFISLVKNKLAFEGSGIRIKDILDDDVPEATGGQETIPSRVYDDFNDDESSSPVTSQSPKTSGKKKDRRKHKRR